LAFINPIRTKRRILKFKKRSSSNAAQIIKDLDLLEILYLDKNPINNLPETFGSLKKDPNRARYLSYCNN